MGIFDSPAGREFLSKATPKVLSAEDIAKTEAEAERKKRAEAIVKYQEMVDNLNNLHSQLGDARTKAMLATPHLGGLTALGAVGGLGGWLDAAAEDPRNIPGIQSQIREFLEANEPHYASLSLEKRELLHKYKEVHEYLQVMIQKYEQARRENDHLVKTVQGMQYGDFDLPYDYEAGADPLYEAELRRRAAAAQRAHPAHQPYTPRHSPYDPYTLRTPHAGLHGAAHQHAGLHTYPHASASHVQDVAQRAAYERGLADANAVQAEREREERARAMYDAAYHQGLRDQAAASAAALGRTPGMGAYTTPAFAARGYPGLDPHYTRH